MGPFVRFAISFQFPYGLWLLVKRFSMKDCVPSQSSSFSGTVCCRRFPQVHVIGHQCSWSKKSADAYSRQATVVSPSQQPSQFSKRHCSYLSHTLENALVLNFNVL